MASLVVLMAVAYCTTLRPDTAWLVYADGAPAPRTRHVRNAGISVVEYPLDLETAPQELLNQVDALARCAQSAAST